MNPNEFIQSAVFDKLNNNIKVLLLDLITKLNKYIDNYIIIQRNEPVLVFKVKDMYESNNKSKCNIATIRFKDNFISVGPYSNNNENAKKCINQPDIDEKLIMDIVKIYNEKLHKFTGKKSGYVEPMGIYKQLFDKVDNYITFNPTESSDYELILLRKDSEIINSFHNFIAQLDVDEKQNKLLVCMRGFTHRDYNETFKQIELNKVFIVGEKGKWYLSHTYDKDIYNEDFNNPQDLFSNITALANDINTKIREINDYQINGQINIKDLNISEKTKITTLRYYKLFFTAVLHNLGKRWSNKSDSPFLSVTYGEDKFTIAKNFALPNRIKNNKSGFIYLCFFNKESDFYILTEKVNEVLKKLGVTWYENIHNEILLLDGLFAKNIIGFFEVFNDEAYTNFYINPWLYRYLVNTKRSKYLMSESTHNRLCLNYGIPVDQEKFNELAKALGYKKYFQEYGIGSRRNVFTIEDEFIGVAGTFINK